MDEHSRVGVDEISPPSVQVIAAQHCYRGRPVHTPWSSTVTITEVLYSVAISRWIFHGVRAVNVDSHVRDWPDVETLLWVFDDGCQLKPWQETRQRPRFTEEESSYEVETSIGSYRSISGNVYVGVKWRGYESPTWELEDDLLQHSGLYDDNICNIVDSSD